MTKLTKRGGFTLIELLLVIGIIAILAAIVIVAINPNKQLADARNAQRRSDVTTILNAVYQYTIDNSGNLPTALPVIAGTATEICSSAVTATCQTATFTNLNALTASGRYLVALPKDPKTFSINGVGYTILKDGNSRITVAAPNAENATISVTR